MADSDRGKRMVEKTILDQLLETLATITGRAVTANGTDGFPRVGVSRDFFVGMDGTPLGIEFAEVRDTEDPWGYFEEVSRVAWNKHKSYERRGLFQHPIALILHSTNPPLFDIKSELISLEAHREFAGVGFVEVWGVDFSDAYYSPGPPLRQADMFCFKPHNWYGFRRIGDHGRKPFG